MMVLVWCVAASRLSVCMRGVSPGGHHSAHLWGLHDGPGVVGSCQQAVSVYERGEPWRSSLGSPLGPP